MKWRQFLKEHPFINGVIIGEGEKTFSELCRYYDEGRRQFGGDEGHSPF